MRSESESNGQQGRTFIEEARRRQIVEAAVEVIVEAGYVNASLSRIAKHVGISKGVISYHFEGKDELMHELVVQLYMLGGEYMAPRIEGCANSRERLRNYIASNLEFISQHRAHVRAMLDVVTNLRHPDGTPHFLAEDGEEVVQAPLIELLRSGQRDGEFGDFDPLTMANIIRDCIDGAAGRAIRSDELDMAGYIERAVDTFDKATSKGG